MEFDDPWRLVLYLTRTGKSPVQDFLDALEHDDPKAAEEFWTIHRPLLCEFGPAVGPPLFDRLPQTEFSEIRWAGKLHSNYRIYCSIEPDRRLVLYHALNKRWRIFRKRDRQLCEKRYHDYHSQAYDHTTRLRARAGTNA